MFQLIPLDEDDGLGFRILLSDLLQPLGHPQQLAPMLAQLGRELLRRYNSCGWSCLLVPEPIAFMGLVYLDTYICHTNQPNVRKYTSHMEAKKGSLGKLTPPNQQLATFQVDAWKIWLSFFKWHLCGRQFLVSGKGRSLKCSTKLRLGFWVPDRFIRIQNTLSSWFIIVPSKACYDS